MFAVDFQVRDYECDMQGIVNNAVYQNYFEHARHEFLQHLGFCFSEITKTGIFLVVYRAEIDYLRPLKSGHSFNVSVACERVSKTRCAFKQELRVGDVIYTKGTFYVAGFNDKQKPVNLDIIESFF